MINAKKIKRFIFSRENVGLVEKEPGIYMFLDSNRKPIYVGKAVNLRNRLKSYLLLTLDPKTAKMVSLAKYFTYIKVTSEIEALLLEAKLVKTFKPKFNIQLKDDKNPLYIKITREEYPQVLTARKIEVKKDVLDYFGPFPNSTSVKSVLRFVRKLFPFAQHKVTKRPCLYSQMGLCEPCPSKIESLSDSSQKAALRKIYLKNIKNIRKILKGKVGEIHKVLNKKMIELSKKEKFEEASFIKRQLEQLEYITRKSNPISDYLKNPNLTEDIYAKESDELLNMLSPYINMKRAPRRVECYDIAHLSGTYPTASMVTFINGVADKSMYRHFKIIQEKSRDDISSMKEIAKRRLKHLDDWGKPDLIVVDGGKAQVGIFWSEFKSFSIPVVGVAKRYETLVVPRKFREIMKFKEIRIPIGPSLNFFQRIRDEAHRFARRLHHKLVEKSMFDENNY